MRAAGTDWQLNVYGNTVHSFTNPDAAQQARPDEIRYNAVTDARAWQAMTTLLAQAIG
jgi:dienelactone hydrolase